MSGEIYKTIRSYQGESGGKVNCTRTIYFIHSANKNMITTKTFSNFQKKNKFLFKAKML